MSSSVIVNQSDQKLLTFSLHLSVSGLDIIQQHWGCEWDNETEKVDGFTQYGLNGDDFISFDRQSETWTAANPWAEAIKQEWDGDTDKLQFWKNHIDYIFPSMLKILLEYGSGFLHRTGGEFIYVSLSGITGIGIHR